MKFNKFSFALVAAVLVGVFAGNIASYIADADAQPVRRVEIFSEVADQASIADAAVGANDIAVVGSEMGDACYASLGVDVVDLGVGCAITVAGTATVTLDNNTGGAVDLASTTFRVFLFRVD